MNQELERILLCRVEVGWPDQEALDGRVVRSGKGEGFELCEIELGQKGVVEVCEGLFAKRVGRCHCGLKPLLIKGVDELMPHHSEIEVHEVGGVCCQLSGRNEQRSAALCPVHQREVAKFSLLCPLKKRNARRTLSWLRDRQAVDRGFPLRAAGEEHACTVRHPGELVYPAVEID